MAEHRVEADVAGVVFGVPVAVGDRLEENDTVMLLESMKMEIPVPAPAAGRVARLEVRPGETVAEGQLLAVIES